MNLAEKYQKEIVPTLQQELGMTSPLAVPRIVKTVINQGIKEAAKDEEVLKKAAVELATITGQKPSVRKAKQAISGFKLSQGDTIGLSVTLRGRRMYDFLTKLFNIVLPRVRDFRGLSESHFDGQGNYTLGLKEIIVFPEIEFVKMDKSRGLEITLVTNVKNDQKAKRLLELMGLPFASEDEIKGKQKGK